METRAYTRRPVLYAGRFAEEAGRSTLPDGCLLLDDWDALPGPLAAAADAASVIVVGDLLSFPFEALAGEAREVPLVLVLPENSDADFLSKVFGETVFARLGFFDGIATSDTAAWQTLRRRYGWAESQRVDVGSDDPAEVAVGVLEGLRGVDWRSEKTAHLTRQAALLPRFAAARGLNTDEVPMDVLQVGAGDGRWAMGFDLAGTRFHGLDEDDEAVVLAGRSFPEGRFERPGPDLVFPHEDEAFDLTFTAGALGNYPVPRKRTLISEMWRVTRPGGRLVFLEDFVGGGESAPHVVSVGAFVEVLMESTAGQVVLEYVESVRYPGEDTVRGGVLAVSRLGVPGRW